MGKLRKKEVKFNLPDAYYERFRQICELNNLKYGRSMWTLIKMFVDNQIDQKSFIYHYKEATKQVSSVHSEILKTHRINGDTAYKLSKLTKPSEKDTMD